MVREGQGWDSWDEDTVREAQGWDSRDEPLRGCAGGLAFPAQQPELLIGRVWWCWSRAKPGDVALEGQIHSPQRWPQGSWSLRDPVLPGSWHGLGQG